VLLLAFALLALTGVAVVGVVALQRIAAALAARAAEGRRDRMLRLFALFSSGAASAADDPRLLLAWQPLAAAARTLYPEEFAALDRANGGTFPFKAEQLQAAHARWSADWLAWEHAHDGEYKLKCAQAEAELSSSGGSPLARARLDAIEREKLELYQRRYAEYVRVSKALQTLLS
jgi:hypothetical protein